MNLTAAKLLVENIISIKGGATFSSVWKMLYYLRMIKYGKQEHIRQFDSSERFKKSSTEPVLLKLVEIGLLKSNGNGVYKTTDDAIQVIHETGYNVFYLPKLISGFGGINSLLNSDQFVKAIHLPYFEALLYPQFPRESPFIIPDALLYLHDRENKRYKLTFLEIEADKPDIEEVLMNKRDNYIKLASDDLVFDYWKNQCQKFKLPAPEKASFCFDVNFICSINLEFGKGFKFIRSL